MKKFLIYTVFLFFISSIFIPYVHAEEKRIDVLILGDQGSGKTSLLNCLKGNSNSYEHNILHDEYGLEYIAKHTDIHGQPVSIVYWDTPTINEHLLDYLIARGIRFPFIIFAYDLARRDEDPLSLLKRSKIFDPIHSGIIIAGTKSDLVSTYMRAELGRRINIFHICSPRGGLFNAVYTETSATTDPDSVMQIETIIKKNLARESHDLLFNYPLL